MDDHAYAEFREGKDEFFKTHPQSPLTPHQRAHFSGLNYYSVNSALQLALTPDEFDEQAPVTMQTSTGDVQTYTRWGRVHFEVDGEMAELTIFANEHGFFVPFQDATSNTETYGAGRYLEPEQLANGELAFDFNMAYNPYCAYNELFSCPIPPFENRLKVPIRAGEKLPVGEWIAH